MQPANRSAIETLVPPAQAAYGDAWYRELVLQLVCLRAELTGRDASDLAREVLPGASAPLMEQEPHAHVLRSLIGSRR